jgi:cytochrome c peroxidase
VAGKIEKSEITNFHSMHSLSIPKCFLLLLTSAALLGCLSRCNRPQTTPKAQLKALVTRDLDSLDHLVERVLLPLARSGRSSDSLQAAFLRCRAAYKKIEFVTEYFMPATSRFVNGPPLDEIETTESEVNEPGGLQVIEEFLFPAFDPAGRADLVREVGKLQSHLGRIRTIWVANDFTDAHAFDAMRLQVFRILSLGLSGFDTPLSGQAVAEAAGSLAALERAAACYPPQSDPARERYASLQDAFRAARQYLAAHPGFGSFDRMAFITRYANPVSARLLAYQQALGYEPFRERRALRGDAATLFDKDAFDPDFFAPDPASYATPEKVALGARLFYDPLLSSDNSRSCATCHQPEKGFTDGLPRSASFTRGQFIQRNAPTLLNAGLQHGQFYDSRSTTLEHQAGVVVENQEEMHGSLAEAVRQLHRQPAYVAQFKAAFPEMTDSIRPPFIQNAIASYVRSLTSLDSPFDRYVRGDGSAMTAEAVLGFNLFMGKAKCGTCHFLPLFNGTVPPAFRHTESEVLGVPATADGKRLDGDPGRFAIDAFPQFKNAFKTPTVRNVALTAPYMHNGVYRTLEEVVDFYNDGGGAGLGLDVPNQTLPGDKLNLDDREKKALVAFMKTLTDLTAARKRGADGAAGAQQVAVRSR